MTVDPRKYSENDKRMPETLSGDTGKVLTVNATEEAYEHVVPGGALTGSVIFWMFNTLPSGYVPVGATYNFDDYPALGALFGASAGQTFDVPAVNFVKNSNGVNSGTEEAESVGTHGHDAEEVPAHGHIVTVTGVGNHTHPSGAAASGKVGVRSDSPNTNVANDGTATGSGGAHNHPASADDAGVHTPVILSHTGTNQPACTLLNIGIKT